MSDMDLHTFGPIIGSYQDADIFDWIKTTSGHRCIYYGVIDLTDPVRQQMIRDHGI